MVTQLVSRFLARLRRPKLEIDLDLSSGLYRPGDELTASVTIMPRENFYVVDGWIQVVCTEYWNTTGGRENQVRTTELVALNQPVLVNTEMLSGVPYAGDISFQLPLDAPPTVKGKVARIKWEARLALEVPDRRDIHEFQEFVVLSLPRDVAAATDLRKERSGGGFILSLSLSSYNIRPGETIAGVFTIRATREATMWFAKVQLRVEEKSGVVVLDTDGDFLLQRNQLTFESEVHLLNGEFREWPFSLRIPEDALPSVATDKTLIGWVVVGSVDWRVRGSLRVQQDVHVYAG